MRVAFAALFLSACGGEDLTCDLLAEPSNCWATAGAAAAACIPMHASAATLSADRQTCTYPDGATIHFDTPLPNSTTELTRLAFDGTGSGCSFRFVDTFNNRMELTAGGKTVVSELHPDRTFHLHCPDVDYESSFDLLFTCRPPAVAPTDGFQVSATSFTFTLASVSTPGPLITCTR